MMFNLSEAFEFIRQKEGRALPREYILSLLRKRDISKLSIPDDFGNDGGLHFTYKLLYAPNTITEKDLHVKGKLDLGGFTALRELPKGLSVGESLDLYGWTSLRELPEELSVGEYLGLRGCTSLEKLPQGLSVGGNLWFNQTDPIPQRFGGDERLIRKYIEQELGGKIKERIYILINETKLDQPSYNTTP